MSRFVKQETTTLTLDNGDHLVVRRQLNAGQVNARFARMSTTNGDGERRVDPLRVGKATVTAYLVDWSLTDDDGRLVEIRGLDLDSLDTVLDNLYPDDFREIRHAIEAHDTRIHDARETEKKTTPSIAPASSTTLPLPSGVTGGTSGSPSLTPTSIAS